MPPKISGIFFLEMPQFLVDIYHPLIKTENI
jgi:hypothetical protein